MNARYLISIFVVSVFPAPLSPLTKIDWLPCSLMIDLRHLQRQTDADLALQTQLLCTVASCGYRINVAISGKDSQLSKCSPCEFWILHPNMGSDNDVYWSSLDNRRNTRLFFTDHHMTGMHVNLVNQFMINGTLTILYQGCTSMNGNEK